MAEAGGGVVVGDRGRGEGGSTSLKCPLLEPCLTILLYSTIQRYLNHIIILSSIIIFCFSC